MSLDDIRKKIDTLGNLGLCALLEVDISCGSGWLDQSDFILGQIWLNGLPKTEYLNGQLTFKLGESWVQQAVETKRRREDLNNLTIQVQAFSGSLPGSKGKRASAPDYVGIAGASGHAFCDATCTHSD